MIEVELDFPPDLPAKIGHGSGFARNKYEQWLRRAVKAMEDCAPLPRGDVRVDILLRRRLGASLSVGVQPVLTAIERAGRRSMTPDTVNLAWGDVPGCRVRIVPLDPMPADAARPGNWSGGQAEGVAA